MLRELSRLLRDPREGIEQVIALLRALLSHELKVDKTLNIPFAARPAPVSRAGASPAGKAKRGNPTMANMLEDNARLAYEAGERLGCHAKLRKFGAQTRRLHLGPPRKDEFSTFLQNRAIIVLLHSKADRLRWSLCRSCQGTREG